MSNRSAAEKQVFNRERKSIMKTKAVRLYGVNDLRLEEFELPEIREDEILAHIISNSIRCV